MDHSQEMLPQLTKTLATSSFNTTLVEEKEIKRDEIFTKWDKPVLGFEQRRVTLLWLGLNHLLACYICYLNFTGQVPLGIATTELIFGYIGGLGITVGCHRYWTHKTFKATRPLQCILMIMQTMAFQYTDTDADPHNSKRGFLFSHVGWLLLPKRKEHQEKLKTFDTTDLENDPIVRFQSKWYWALALSLYIPMVLITYYIWEIPLLYSIASNSRKIIVFFHITCLVNSAAHMWGDTPYDKSITASENSFVSFLAAGEGWHNYHHTFPWDYKTSEFGWKVNLSTIFIDFFASIGWAYDLKTVSPKMVKERRLRSGEGLHPDAKSSGVGHDAAELMKASGKDVWGWEDDTLSQEFRKFTNILKPG